MEDHKVHRGSLFLLPANSIISMYDLSADYAPIDVSFFSSSVDSLRLVARGYLQSDLLKDTFRISSGNRWSSLPARQVVSCRREG